MDTLLESWLDFVSKAQNQQKAEEEDANAPSSVVDALMKRGGLSREEAEEMVRREIELEEAADPCWKGYKKQGMKKKGDKMVPNCVPLEEEVIEEKDDRCTRIAKRKYDVWPSAYASGAVVRCRAGKIWKGVKEDIDVEALLENTEYEDLLETLQEMELSDEEAKELRAIEKELNKASKMHKGQADRIGDVVKEAKKKKAGTESSKESSLRDWFGRKGAKGSTSGWVDCNAPDGKGGYKSCGREKGEKRSKYPACRPTPGACKERGKGKSWGKKASKKEHVMDSNELKGIITEEVNRFFLESQVFPYLTEAFLDDGTPVCVECLMEQLDTAACGCPDLVYEAEYQGRKVTLNKPTRGDVKKFKVYVKDPSTGNIKKVNFGHGGSSAKAKGEKTMKIRKSNPEARKNFRARHNCDNPGPKTKARYWSCKKW